MLFQAFPQPEMYNLYCTFQVGCQENRQNKSIQCRPHCHSKDKSCGLHILNGFFPPELCMFAEPLQQPNQLKML